MSKRLSEFVLLPPHLAPLGVAQEAEAVSLLAELLVEAAKRRGLDSVLASGLVSPSGFGSAIPDGENGGKARDAA